ncbi:general stress protein [Salinithrix halophila]|uniref:General stress protein n=1 Tax=Salinithrix halophila TaxID=1485204 RepID=A0ABV8JCJ7_9BACL
MKPIVKEFRNDEKLVATVKDLEAHGINYKDIYILSHDEERTKRVADKADANTVGIQEMGLGTSVGNLFNKKGAELRNKLEELGFSELEADHYEERLDQGVILLMVTDHEQVKEIF